MQIVTVIGLVIVSIFSVVFRFGQCQEDKDFACGVPRKTIVETILHGETADAQEHPWHSTIFQKVGENDWKYMCGGTLINDQFVVTAKHCTLKEGMGRQVTNDKILVKLGLQEWDYENEHSQRFTVTTIYTVTDNQWQKFRNDIALIKLSDTVKFTKHILPACLVSEKVTEKDSGIVVGFGLTEGNDNSTLLRALEMPVIKPFTCIRRHREFGDFIDENQFCAGHTDGRAVCNGDSGGGLLFLRNGTMQLGGIVSFTVPRSKFDYKCKEDGYAVFASVYSYLPWIKLITKAGAKSTEINPEETNVAGKPSLKEQVTTDYKLENDGCGTSNNGCCPDRVSPSKGPNNQGCPQSNCAESLYGCCSDKFTPSEGNDFEGCPEETTTIGGCVISKHGCCPNGVTEAKGANNMGCPGVEESTEGKPEETVTEPGEKLKDEECGPSQHGCCPDGVTAASGANGEGCAVCSKEPFGCCPDGQTPAHGPNREGCCLETPYGCCPDNINPARGPDLEGCECEYSPYGCCPDNTTAARGHNNQGCGCQYSEHGCCPDKETDAPGPNFDGCPCHAFQFGCCPDGVTPAKGPHNHGCHCSYSQFKCYSDGQTPATGPNFEGCTCASSKHECCPDGVNEAQGSKFEGCEVVPKTPQNACTLKKDMGTCHNYTVKYFFDVEYGGCVRFWYGGCGGNKNRFDTSEDCTEVCEVPEGKAKCQLLKITGPCTGYYPKWYYDIDRNTCLQFTYGGCLGNANRFETLDECKSSCVVDDSIPPCDQPKESGPCNGTFERWYFDKERDTCEPFPYGGCKGNKNNYPTENSCNYQCKKPGIHKPNCALPLDESRCDAKLARWHFALGDNKCAPFYYTGCSGNDNQFVSLDECEEQCPPKVEKDVCFLPAEIGECQNYTAHWYFDTKDSRCRQFYYGGCGGNSNNFVDEEACNQRCVHGGQPKPEPQVPEPQPQPQPQPEQPGRFDIRYCFLDPDFGDRECKQYERRYHYDRNSGTCMDFTYTGCAGNENNFRSFEQCDHACGRAEDACSLCPAYGRCAENETRWYYDGRSQRCHEFTFSGCHGNANNFNTEQECSQQCLRGEPEPARVAPPTTVGGVCDEPYDYGTGDSPGIVYVFNKERASCESNYYSGEGGSGNRFSSQEECERQCGEYRGVDVCVEARDAGPCDETIPRFYYDSRTANCHPFNYSGCEGNGNRFATIEECQNTCVKKIDSEFELLTKLPPYGDHTLPVPEKELDIKLEEGGIATLRCHVTGSLPPSIRWKKGEVLLNTNQGRFVLTSNGDLQIVQLHRTDSGTYVCIADNGIGEPVLREVKLQVNDPVPRDAYIVGDINETQVVELNQPTQIRCLAGGYPKLIVTWWRETFMMPVKLINRHHSLTFTRVRLSDLGPYVCQAYTGAGKGITRMVTLKANGPVQLDDQVDEKYLRYIVDDRSAPPPPVHRPDPVPVSVQLELPQGAQFAPNSNITLHCHADGYPRPTVNWYKDGRIMEPSNRTYIEDNNTLHVFGVLPTDAGAYRCLARNEHSDAFQENTIRVEGVYIPPGCTDYAFLAKCATIVQARFCNHKYYFRFCCKSCTLAGQLRH